MRLVSAAYAAALFASPSIAADASTTACSTVAACIFATNTSSGYAIQGSSKSNDGIVGITTLNSTSAATGKSGVSGYDNSTSKTTYNSGVYGTSNYGYGVQGKSSSGIGVFGTTSSTQGNTSQVIAGVFGAATGNSPHVSGLYGTSDYGSGIIGESDNIYGVYGESFGGAGVGAFASHPASVAFEATTIFADSFHGVTIAGSEPTLTSAISANGDMTLAGSLTTHGTPYFQTTDSSGAKVVTYGSRSTIATLDDVGEGAVVNGYGYVHLDPEFARTIDPRSRYLVFITPEGNSRGLYTSNLNAQGFGVHENEGGRSTLPFAYRIVAHPLDDTSQLKLPSASVLPHQLGTVRNDFAASEMLSKAKRLRIPVGL